MIKFKRDNEALIVIRSAAWRRAKAELMTIVDTISADSVHEVRVYKALVNRIQNFQSNFIEVMDEQDDSISSTKQPCIDAGSPKDGSPKVNAIEWSEASRPDSGCDRRCVGETPIGQFLICWKFRPTGLLIEFVVGSNEDFTVKQSPIGSIDVSGEDRLQGVKDCCQKEYELHILRCLMSQELPI